MVSPRNDDPSPQPEKLRQISFFIEMPDAVAFPHHADFTFWLPERVPALDGVTVQTTSNSQPRAFQEGRLFVTVKFWQAKAALRLPFTEALWSVIDAVIQGRPETREEPPGIDSYRTVIQTTTLLMDEDGDQAVTTAFDRCLHWIQRLCRAYRIATHQMIEPVSIERLPLAVPFAVTPLGEPYTDLTGIFTLHLNTPDLVPPDPLTSEVQSRVNAVLQRLPTGDPFTFAHEQFEEARRFFYRVGDYGNAVTHAHIAAEILLDGVLMFMLWEEKKSAADAAKVFDSGLAKRVRLDYSPRLGGNWDPTSSGAVGKFDQDLMKLRGRVVHAGYEPSKAETDAALRAYGDLFDFVKDRLIEKRNKYPISVLHIAGQPGLERRGLWKGRIKQFVEDPANHDSKWLVAFSKWRDDANAFRT